jgi:hypothetical protein
VNNALRHLPRSDAALYGQQVKVERHWWNGSLSPRDRRDVFIRSNGQQWDVVAQVGGSHGRSRVHRCPGRATAEILASAWRGAGADWREVPADDAGEPSTPVRSTTRVVS